MVFSILQIQLITCRVAANLRLQQPRRPNHCNQVLARAPVKTLMIYNLQVASAQFLGGKCFFLLIVVLAQDLGLDTRAKCVCLGRFNPLRFGSKSKSIV